MIGCSHAKLTLEYEYVGGFLKRLKGELGGKRVM